MVERRTQPRDLSGSLDLVLLVLQQHPPHVLLARHVLRRAQRRLEAVHRGLQLVRRSALVKHLPRPLLRRVCADLRSSQRR